MEHGIVLVESRQCVRGVSCEICARPPEPFAKMPWHFPRDALALCPLCALAPRRKGDGGFPIQIGGGFLYNTYPYVFCMYPACILHVFRCVPFIDIKIHRDTSRYICICHFDYHMKCILPWDLYPSLRYIQDTMKIHLGYNVS